MAPPRSVMLCALLALAAHAALLAFRQDSPADTRGGGAPAAALHINLVKALPSVSTSAAADITPAADSAADAAASSAATPGRSTAPDFLDGPPETGLPDVFMPEGGVQVRAFLQVAADGQVLDIATATRPGDAPEAYQELSERLLRQARLGTTEQPRVHCLQLDFMPSHNRATWAWRPDATARQCLTSKAKTARALPAPH